MPQTFDEDDTIFVPSAGIADLTNSFGTANGAIEDVTATPTQAAINNNFRECSDKLNQVLAALREANIIAQD